MGGGSSREDISPKGYDPLGNDQGIWDRPYHSILFQPKKFYERLGIPPSDGDTVTDRENKQCYDASGLYHNGLVRDTIWKDKSKPPTWLEETRYKECECAGVVKYGYGGGDYGGNQLHQGRLQYTNYKDIGWEDFYDDLVDEALRKKLYIKNKETEFDLVDLVKLRNLWVQVPMNGGFECQHSTFKEAVSEKWGVKLGERHLAAGLYRTCQCLEFQWHNCKDSSLTILSNLYNNTATLSCEHWGNPDVVKERTCAKFKYGKKCNIECKHGSDCIGGVCNEVGKCTCLNYHYNYRNGYQCNKLAAEELCPTGVSSYAFEDHQLRKWGRAPLAEQRIRDEMDAVAPYFNRTGVRLTRCIKRCNSFEDFYFREASNWDHASMSTEVDSYKGGASAGCYCPEMKFGDRCKKRIYPCEASPCAYGTCHVDTNDDYKYTCTCYEGFFGNRCEWSVRNLLGFKTTLLPPAKYLASLQNKFYPTIAVMDDSVDVITIGFKLNRAPGISNPAMKIEIALKDNELATGFVMTFDLENGQVYTNKREQFSTRTILPHEPYFTRGDYEYDSENDVYFDGFLFNAQLFNPDLTQRYKNLWDANVWNVRIVLYDFIPKPATDTDEINQHMMGWKLFINDKPEAFWAYDLWPSLDRRTFDQPHFVTARPHADSIRDNIDNFYLKVVKENIPLNTRIRNNRPGATANVVIYGGTSRSIRDPRLVRATTEAMAGRVDITVGSRFKAAEVGPKCDIKSGIVMLSGSIKRKSSAPKNIGEALAYLPKECEPAADIVFNVYTGGAIPDLVLIETDGKIVLKGSSDHVFLDNIAYLQPTDRHAIVYTARSMVPEGAALVYNNDTHYCEVQGLVKASEIVGTYTLPIECDPEGATDELIKIAEVTKDILTLKPVNMEIKKAKYEYVPDPRYPDDIAQRLPDKIASPVEMTISLQVVLDTTFITFVRTMWKALDVHIPVPKP